MNAADRAVAKQLIDQTRRQRVATATARPRRKPPQPPAAAPVDAQIDALRFHLIQLERMVETAKAELAELTAFVRSDRVASGWLAAEREIHRLRNGGN